MKKVNFILEDELHKQIKVFCAKNNISITQYLIRLVLEDLKKREVK